MARPKTDPPRGVLKTADAGGPRMAHARYHPSADLASYVEHFWAVEWHLDGQPPHRAETLPHPSVHLVFELGGGARISGVARGKFVRLLEGHGSVIAAKFRPAGFYPFLQRPMTTLTDQVVTLDSIWGPAGHALEQAVFAAGDNDARIVVVENFLRTRNPIPDENVSLATTIVETIATDRALLTVDDVTRRWNLNLRALQRLFARYVGVNPKWVIQRYRLHEAAEQLARGPASQSALALALGYADQAHFVKDFKAAVGTSPAAYAKRARG